MTERETQIKAAAITLLLQEGVGVSTASIAKAAEVSNGTLFNAFATKQLLIDSIYSDAKTAMFASLRHSGDAAFTRANLYENWCGYLDWARANQKSRSIMHLLLDAGLVSANTQAEVDVIAEPHGTWVQRALDSGVIRGPSVSFICRLILFHIDLVITENLDSTGADLAFDMLCTSLRVTQ